MKNRALMGLVVAVGLLMSSVAWGKLPDQSDFITPNKTLPPWTGLLTSGCAASPFSTKLEDYLMTMRIAPNDKNAWQVALYARLDADVDSSQLPVINNQMTLEDASKMKPENFWAAWEHPFAHFLLMAPYGWSQLVDACEFLPNKDGSTKGNWVRCTVTMPGTEKLEHMQTNDVSKYVLTDGSLDKSDSTSYVQCNRLPSSLTPKKMFENAGTDGDADGVPDSIDNCPTVANFSQDVDAGGKPVACPEAAACDAATVCTEEACANNGFGGSCDVGTLCTADVCAQLGLSTGNGAGGGTGGLDLADSGGMCALIPVGAANPAGLILLLSAVGLIAARRRS